MLKYMCLNINMFLLKEKSLVPTEQPLPSQMTPLPEKSSSISPHRRFTKSVRNLNANQIWYILQTSITVQKWYCYYIMCNEMLIIYVCFPQATVTVPPQSANNTPVKSPVIASSLKKTINRTPNRKQVCWYHTLNHN